MISTLALTRQRFDVPCTVEVECSAESLHAHVVFDDDVAIGPGDEVLVHGAPVRVGFGESRVIRRQATVVRASGLARLWTRLTGTFEATELMDVSFTERMTL